MKLTTEQAKLLLGADPFVIVRVFIDDEGYIDPDFEPVAVATNVLWDAKELNKFVKGEQPEFYADLRSCEAVYLCHLKLQSEEMPRYGSFWELTEAELVSTEPFYS